MLPAPHYGKPIVSIGVVHAKRRMATTTTTTSERSALPTPSFSSRCPLFSLTSTSPYHRGASLSSGVSFFRRGGPSTTRRWMATSTVDTMPYSEDPSENRSALLRLLHDPQDAYLASIAELSPSSIVKVMKRGPQFDTPHKEGEAKEEKKEGGGGEADKEAQIVQHALEGLYAMNAVLRMILEDPSSLEEATEAVNAAHEGFVWVYSHYAHRQVSLRAIEQESAVLEEEEAVGKDDETENGTMNEETPNSNENASESSCRPSTPPPCGASSSGVAEGADSVKDSTRREREAEGNEAARSEEGIEWSISREKWEVDFKPELNELQNMLDSIGERRKIHLNERRFGK